MSVAVSGGATELFGLGTGSVGTVHGYRNQPGTAMVALQLAASMGFGHRGKVAALPFVFLTTALETCSTLEGVELLVSELDRRGAMMLSAVDGKRGLGAVFECTCSTYVKREMERGSIVGTNHHCESGGQEGLGDAT